MVLLVFLRVRKTENLIRAVCSFSLAFCVVCFVILNFLLYELTLTSLEQSVTDQPAGELL
jgi:hypothetical protein